MTTDVRKFRNFVKKYLFVYKKSHAYLQYTFNICAKFQINRLKIVGRGSVQKLATYIEA